MKTLECNVCGVEVRVSPDVIGVVCHLCISEQTAATEPPTQKKPKPGYPKGWRFMKEFVHADGTVYHRGVEQPELKGKLEATPIIEKPKLSKKQKEQEKMTLIDEYTALKKKLKTEKRKATRKKIEARLNKISKLI